MNLSSSTISSFEKVFNSRSEIKELFFKPAVLAYSGGKDSTIILEFYRYLYEKYTIPKPYVFHLDHQIRNNFTQEREIQEYLTGYPFLSFCKKKISQN
jgi:tRNA(Ile)-lysidine synthase